MKIAHWLIVGLLIIVSLVLGNWLDKQEVWIQWRYQVYQAMQSTSIRQPGVSNTAVVLVTDEEYWRGELARRTPLKRDYLAKLIVATQRADPAVIAVDFDLRSPMQDGSLQDHKDYLVEDNKLFEAIQAVSLKCPVVLPANITSSIDDMHDLGRSIYQDKIKCKKCQIGVGYTEIPLDVRRVPISLRRGDGRLIDSLAAATVRFKSTDVYRKIVSSGSNSDEALPFGRFFPVNSFPLLSASQVLKGDPRVKDLKGKIVLLGASWSRLSYGRGGLIDASVTPVGVIAEAYVHANYIETILANQTVDAPSPWLAYTIEISLALGLAWCLSRPGKGRRKLIILSVFLVIALFVAYVLFQNIGIYFDFLIPLILLGGHAGVEQVIEWRAGAARQRAWDASREPVSN